MVRNSILTVVFILSLSLQYTVAQKIYAVSGGEMIFQSVMVKQNNEDVGTNMRFTMWFHAGEFVHLDAGNNIGFFSGMGMRNIGFITSEDNVTIKYRSYNLGIPLALKLGSFKDNFYIYGGVEYEWMFHFKQKTIINGEKTKYSKWFSDRTPAFIPSVFAGIQFPKGINVRFRYYLDDFLNNKFKVSDEYHDYTSFTKTRIWYISLSFYLKNSKLREKDYLPGSIAAI